MQQPRGSSQGDLGNWISRNLPWIFSAIYFAAQTWFNGQSDISALKSQVQIIQTQQQRDVAFKECAALHIEMIEAGLHTTPPCSLDDQK